MDFLDYPMTPENIAKLCGVSTRTARRWISGQSKPPKSARELLVLHQNGRIMPPKWPHGWKFNDAGYFDVGHSKALAWQQVDWYFYSAQCWHQLLDMIPRIEARIDYLMRSAPQAVVIDLQRYKDELKRLKERQFTLPADLREYYQLEPPETHRKFGC